ncbi:MAG TPA: hypothetical protein VFH59_17420 [Frateuria sp.]|uniref:hypothetical protein n=1 Tax=Frateuria sp. TaxID=2211372 RepID=UPI002D7F4288|nr:hypothetical protein [Frateuria sp.]HET6807219.1 hypothetical protein [Frateuria sp.]
MSAVMDIRTARQRKGFIAYNAARAEAIRTSERHAMRAAEQEWRAQPLPVVIHRTRARTTLWQRLRAALVAEFGRRWWLALIGAALYFVSGTAAGVAVALAYMGHQP